ncbi:MAG TPA: hypothetical protein PKM97_09705 [Bacteroidia bacterium]|nr:hypothetical protein [Bacteroidia bacterium]
MKLNQHILFRLHLPLFFVLNLLCFSFTTILAGVVTAPEKMNYQAVARDAAGNPLLSQAISVRFSIRATTASGTIEYQETQSLTTNSFGLFSTAIGSGTVSSGSWNAISWESTDHFLQVEFDPAGGTSWIDMGTSQLLSVPYSYFSNTSITSLDNHWSSFGNDIWKDIIAGNVGIGTSTPTHRLDVQHASPAPNTGILNVTATQSPLSYSDAYAVYGANDVDDWHGIGGVFRGGYQGVSGTVEPTGSQYYHGLYGSTFGGSGTNIGAFGYSDQVGVYGGGTGSGTGRTSYYGSSFLECIGVEGSGQVNSTTNGISYGVVGTATSGGSKNNTGIFGYARGAMGTNARNWGVLGVSDDPTSATGLLGISDPGSAGSNGHGIEGDVLSGADQVAIFGYTVGSTVADYAGYFLGNIYATSASSGIKAFKIDYPLDPENKYLIHSSVESNEMLNMYSGNITTDAQGYAVVLLPEYFETLNKDFRYQFTCINEFAQAIVGEKIHNNQFTIRTDKPNVEVSWMVTGVRHDPLANKYRIQDLVDKPESEKGTYLTPELYGKTIEQATHKPSYLKKGSPVNVVRNPLDDPKLKRK